LSKFKHRDHPQGRPTGQARRAGPQGRQSPTVAEILMI